MKCAIHPGSTRIATPASSYGSTTGLTIGRANDNLSFVRVYHDDNDEDDFGLSKEWSILLFDNKPGPFSAEGDSGSVIVDSSGRIGGLLISDAQVQFGPVLDQIL